MNLKKIKRMSQVVVYLLFITVGLGSCAEQSEENKLEESLEVLVDSTNSIDSISLVQDLPTLDTFNRLSIVSRLQDKITQKEPLVVHIFIPLCDNIHQGIVPTTPSLGNGMSIRTNLYWATRGGTKRFFRDHKKWKQIFTIQNIDSVILERAVFERDYSDAKVYIVADAYRGDRMGNTINDFLASLSMNKKELLQVDSSLQIPISSNADLLMFNGHNGLMDYPKVQTWINRTEYKLDAVINACVSFDYFEEELKRAQAYPLARTTSLLYPGAYVLSQIIDDWVEGLAPVKICLNAGRAYCKKHDCGSGRKIYRTGWQ